MTDIFVAPKEKNKPTIVNDEQPMSIFSSFCQNPKGIHFQTQKSDEVILLFLRSHFIVNLSWILVSLTLLLLPIIILMFLPRLGIDSQNSAVAAKFTTVYVLFYYLIVFAYIFISFLHWFYNVFMVTSQRVVDIDYSDVVVHHIAVTNLNQVQDAKYTQAGFIPSLFNYGNIFVQTAGTQLNFEEPSIPKPREATHIIGDLIGKKH